MDPRDKRQNLANLIDRIENEPGFKDQLLQEFLNAETDKDIKVKYDLSNYAIKTIRREYDWGDLIKTTRFARNWAKEHPKEEKPKSKSRVFPKREHRDELIRKAEESEEFKATLLQEFLDTSEDELISKYDLATDGPRDIRRHFGWAQYIKKTRLKNNLMAEYGVTNVSQLKFYRDSVGASAKDKHLEEFIAKLENDKEFFDIFYNEIINDESRKHKDVREKYQLRCHDIEVLKKKFNLKVPNWLKVERTSKTLKRMYGVEAENVSQIPHIFRGSTRKYTADNGDLFRSSDEVKVANYFIRNNISFESEIPINYEYEGKHHITFIDFKVGDTLFEVKGSHLLKGVFSDRTNVPISAKIDLYKENHVVVITDKSASYLFGKKDSSESAGFKYPNKCPNPLIGVDIDLFDSPSFPYRADRPKCFYDVSVNGKPTQYEAFNNEKLRWEMIKNRINYVGGFIDSKEVLYALNVTRKSKQPSWFSKKFAKDIITKYITSDTIVDSFAGWGTRCDASVELGKQYIGIDYNKELVDWHKSMGRNIEFGDANLFTYDKECSVFICPPYTDIEVYFDGQDLETTQCEWLKIVMKNIPNAKEYIMVCKVVDEGWEKYIVGTKTNKSLFSTNDEYILKLTQKEKNKLFNE